MELIVILILTGIITICSAKVILGNTVAYSSDGIAGIIKVYLSSLLTIGLVSFGVATLIVYAIEQIFALMIDYWYVTLSLICGIVWLFNKFKEDSLNTDNAGSFSDGNNLPVNTEIQQLPAVSIEELQRKVEHGDPSAQYTLGTCYFNGNNIEQDKPNAIEWYCKAAEQGHPAAQYNLGRCYEQGDGVEQNQEEAIKWYHKAAEQGYADAKAELELLQSTKIFLDAIDESTFNLVFATIGGGVMAAGAVRLVYENFWLWLTYVAGICIVFYIYDKFDKFKKINVRSGKNASTIRVFMATFEIILNKNWG